MNIKEFLKKRIIDFFSLFPLQENTILLESNSEIKDNTKAIFEKCLEKNLNKTYKIVWFVEDKVKYKEKYKKYKNIKFIYKNKLKTTISLSRMYYSCTAKYCFYTHLFIGLRNKPGQVKVFLTHGTPIKDTRGLFWNPYLNSSIISTSEYAATLRCKTFDGGKDIVKILGFPRNDYLFINDDGTNNFIESLQVEKFIIWMPTFKHFNIKESNRNDFCDNDNSKTDISLLNREFLEKLNNKLKKEKCFLIIKFHPAQDMNYVIKENFSNISMMTNEELEKKNVDLYSLMGKSAALITDFSSVYIDYLLVNKPIGFELNDFEKFKKGRGFIVENPLELMPGLKITNEDELVAFIENVCNNKDDFKKEREELRKKMHYYIDGNSSERILKYYGLLGDEYDEKEI